jgi:gluconokinase
VILIVAGVAGSGKTTVGALLAEQLSWQFADADTFHSPANVEKMRNGEPLTDEDRAPWLQAICAWLDEHIAAGQPGVITCSALKRSYRDLLLADRPAVTMVFLDVDREILLRRVAARPGHFFPRKLLESQLAALERPSPAEAPRVLLITEDASTEDGNQDASTEDGGAQETAAKIIAMLRPHGMGEPATGIG